MALRKLRMVHERRPQRPRRRLPKPGDADTEFTRLYPLRRVAGLHAVGDFDDSPFVRRRA